MQRYEAVKATRKELFISNFVGGIAWTLGATIGGAVILTILSLIFKNINLVPIVGSFVADIIKFIQTNGK